MKDRFDRFSCAMSEIYRCWHRIASQVMNEYGLKGGCSVYFTALRNQDGGLTAARLSELCGRNKSDVSRMMAQMIEKGFVRKEAKGDKSYRAKLFLTEDGRRVAERISERAKMAVHIGGLGLDEEMREAFYSALELISKNLQAISTKDVFLNQPTIVQEG